MIRRNFLASTLSLISLAGCGGGGGSPNYPEFSVSKQSFKWKGYNLTSWDRWGFSSGMWPVTEAFNHILDSGANFVVIDWVVNFNDDGTIVPFKAGVLDQNIATASAHPPLSDLAGIVARAKSLGMTVCLKPHCTMATTAENRNHWNTPTNKFLPANFFPAWKDYLSFLLANLAGADGLCVGTELNMLDTAYVPEWTDLITSLRSVSSAWLTSDAIFNRSSQVTDIGEVAIWNQLDYIGVSLYVPATKNDKATVEEIMAAWTSDSASGLTLGNVGSVTSYLRSISLKYGKKVIVLEGGYESASGGLYDVNGAISDSRTVDFDLQSRGLEAYLRQLYENQGPQGGLDNWLGGVSLWQVNPAMMAPYQLSWIWYLQDFTTYQKPAAAVVKKYYTL